MQIPKDLPVIYLVCLGDGTITHVNKLLSDLLGLKEETLLGKNIEEIFSPASKIFYQTHLYPLVQMKGFVDEIYLTLRNSNQAETPFLLNVAKVMDQGSGSFHFSGVSMLKRVRFEEEILRARKTAEDALAENSTLQRAREELEKYSAQLETLLRNADQTTEEFRQFNHVATHELQEPMRKLHIYTDRLKRAMPENELAPLWKKMDETVGRFRVVLEGLQQYLWATEMPFSWKSVNLRSSVELALKKAKREFPDVQVESELSSPEVPDIQADESQLEFLLVEILNNAVKFRKPGTMVSIQILLSVVLLNKYKKLTQRFTLAEFVRLEIRDNGTGMEETFCKQALGLFKKLHENSGDGVKLALCKRIVENHGGNMDIQSRTNEGTSVIIFLPVKQEEE